MFFRSFHQCFFVTTQQQSTALKSFFPRVPDVTRTFIHTHRVQHLVNSRSLNVIQKLTVIIHTKGERERAFSAAVPELWSALPSVIQFPPSFETFKVNFRTLLLSRNFKDSWTIYSFNNVSKVATICFTCLIAKAHSRLNNSSPKVPLEWLNSPDTFTDAVSAFV